MKPKHPYDIDSLKYSPFPYLTLATKGTIEISVEPGRGAVLPFPNRIEVYIYDSDKNLHLYQAVGDTNEVKMFNLTTPSEPGFNMFLLKAIYKDEVQGISYHPFRIYTK